MISGRVDLTKGRSYGRLGNPHSETIITSMIRKIPWNFQSVERELTYTKKYRFTDPDGYPLVPTGSTYDIWLYKACGYFSTGKFCDCCGKEINNIPWRKRKTLCAACEAHMYENFEREPTPAPWKCCEESSRRYPSPWWKNI